MKSDSDEAFAARLSARAVRPAEACSELGFAAERRDASSLLGRWLRAARRWLMSMKNGSRANG